MLKRILLLLMVAALTIPAFAQQDDDDPIKLEGFFGTDTMTFDGEIAISYPLDWHTEAVAGGVVVTNNVELIDSMDSPDLVEPATGEILLNINVLPQSLTAEQDVETAAELIDLVISEASDYTFGEVETYTLRGRERNHRRRSDT